jgi:glycosyltransferase involved in cell wall biosynthesis
MDSKLLIVGDGPLRGEVETEIERLGLDDRVQVLLRVASTAVPELMRGLDALILPSISTPSWKEQFGRVLIEAMACGVPVIGSDSGEIPHVIGDAGLIVPEGNEAALSNAMERLHDDANLRRDLGKRGRERVLAYFTHRKVAVRTLEAYKLTLA